MLNFNGVDISKITNEHAGAFQIHLSWSFSDIQVLFRIIELQVIFHVDDVLNQIQFEMLKILVVIKV